MIKILLYFISIFTFLNSAYATTPDQVQASFDSLAEEVTESFPYVENLVLQIDQENTDFNAGALSAVLSMTTVPLNWETIEEPQSVVLNAKINTNVVKNLETYALAANAQVEIKTNTMAMLKQVAAVYGSCEFIPEDEIESDEDIQENLICVVIKGIEQSEKAKDLEPHLVKLAEMAQKLIEPDPTGKSNWLLTLLENLGITSTENGVNLTSILKLETFDISLETLSLSIEDHAITLDLQGTANLSEDDYQQFTGKIKDVASEIANREGENFETLEETVFTVVGVLEGFLVPFDEDE